MVGFDAVNISATFGKPWSRAIRKRADRERVEVADKAARAASVSGSSRIETAIRRSSVVVLVVIRLGG